MYSSPPSQQNTQGGSASVSGRSGFLSPNANSTLLDTFRGTKTNRDGKAPKRRGPKPDSKPALTRRQEMNRQAQRTHRERKELYVKALEEEALRLKEICKDMKRSKGRLADENRQLRAQLQEHGIMPVVPVTVEEDDDTLISSPPDLSVSGSQPSASFPPSSGGPAFSPIASSASPLYQGSPNSGYHQQMQSGLDYEQAGINFVLALEKPCMDHLGFLVERSRAPGSRNSCGHALMASCPPNESPISNNQMATPSPQPPETTTGCDQSYQAGREAALSKADLATLLELSQQLDLNGEVTPIMAWGMVLSHPRQSQLTSEDLVRLSDDLKGKVRCYGFGAVMEEFEVTDAINGIFSSKEEPGMVY